MFCFFKKYYFSGVIYLTAFWSSEVHLIVFFLFIRLKYLKAFRKHRNGLETFPDTMCKLIRTSTHKLKSIVRVQLFNFVTYLFHWLCYTIEKKVRSLSRNHFRTSMNAKLQRYWTLILVSPIRMTWPRAFYGAVLHECQRWPYVLAPDGP